MCNKLLVLKLKAKVFSFAFLAFLLMGSFVFAQEKINSFYVVPGIEKNSTVLVQESIAYDFGLNLKHGIYRDIYSKDIDIQVKGVQMDDAPIKYGITKLGDTIRVKIGDPNKTITGVHNYFIVYLVKGAVKFLPDHDEFYWNVTGNSWTVPIESVAVVVGLPQELTAKEINLKCYAGPFKSTSQNCTTSFNGAPWFQTIQPLAVGDGLTIVVGWPKGIVNPPGLLEKLGDFAKKFWLFLIPVIVFIILFIVWWKKGRDIKLHKSIVAQYDLPNDLRPVEVAYILNQKISSRDFSATIIDLAVRGYLKIKETQTKLFLTKQKDWILIKQKNFASDETFEPFEHYLLSNLFSASDQVAISSLRQKFYKTFQEFQDSVSKEMVLDDYFISNPNKIKATYWKISILLLFIIPLIISKIFPFFGSSFNVSPMLILLISMILGGLFFVFSFFMPKKTKKGTEILWHIMGFKEYITKAEKYRAQFQEKENIFEKFLPYAIIFGCTKKWAKAFEGIYKTPPSWYEGVAYGAFFSATDFSKSLDRSLAGIGTALASKPGGGSGSSGFSGGFSGGGFGGGGGGSW